MLFAIFRDRAGHQWPGEPSLNIWGTIQVLSSMRGKRDVRVRGRLPAYVQALMPKPFFRPTSILPLPFLAWEADPTGALASRVATGQRAGSRLPVGLLQLPPHWPSTHKREKKSAGKGGRQVLLSGSLVSMETGSALLQLLTPPSLCHPIFS